ncbi:hypothetical protein [Bifidobacterium sp. ESL0732]|nr:hypothetical protein [Bifidobacterium sp. ESL0732]WEV63824.1 hypothetical protein OZX70_07795 [Bifidobacterium sp. ESL0732]
MTIETSGIIVIWLNDERSDSEIRRQMPSAKYCIFEKTPPES